MFKDLMKRLNVLISITVIIQFMSCSFLKPQRKGQENSKTGEAQAEGESQIKVDF